MSFPRFDCRCIGCNPPDDEEENMPEWDTGPAAHPAVVLARDYLAKNAAESGADVLIRELADALEKYHDALRTAEMSDGQHANCGECEGLEAPEACGECFPLADDARLKRRAALGVSQPVT